MFQTFLQEGIHHILDPKAYDHILFVVSICVIFQWFEWKKVIILVTAFTLGHSLTLALASLDIININPGLVETLIPITIILSAATNLIRQKKSDQNFTIQYSLAAFFGLIHGLGFSNYLKSLLAGEEDIIGPLLAFNIGVEIGQIAIVCMTILIGTALTLFKAKHILYARIILVCVIILSSYLLIANTFG